MEIVCPKCKSKIKVNDSKKIMRVIRQTTIIEFVVSDGNQPHTKKVFLNYLLIFKQASINLEFVKIFGPFFVSKKSFSNLHPPNPLMYTAGSIVKIILG